MFIFKDRDLFTIASVCSAPGYGAVSVIRLSGKDSFQIVNKLLKRKKDTFESHKAFLMDLIDPISNEVIDETVILPYAPGKSYTGEETVELFCHGSPVVCQRILDSLCCCGAVIALNGEFSFRAFMNNRIDLVQAEAILNLVHSSSQESANLALNQLKGYLSKALGELEKTLIWCLAHIEASIDFSTEGIETVSDTILMEKLIYVKEQLELIVLNYKKGKTLNEGVKLSILGSPNVGKSSILNMLLGEERSIVSNIAGTTRDVVKDDFILDGIKYVVMDTAGIRSDTDDPIENMGIKRSLEQISVSNALLITFDVSVLNFSVLEEISTSDLGKSIFILNKIDKVSSQDILDFQNELTARLRIKNIDTSFMKDRTIRTSAINASERQQLLYKIHGIISKEFLIKFNEGAVVSSARQVEELKACLSLLNQALEGIKLKIGAEFVTLELRDSLICLQRVLGIVYDDQILDKVFKEFCLGK